MPPPDIRSEAPSPEVDYAAHPYRWVVLAGAWLAYVCFGMTVASLAPLVQPITLDLAISHSALGTILGAWPMVYIAAAAACGALTDRIGPRRTILLALSIIAASGALRGFAQGYWELFFSVAVFGFGGPLVSIGAPKLVSVWFAGKQRGLAMGIYTTGSSLGLVISLSATNSVFMPLMNDHWRYVMFLYAGIALTAALVWFAIGCHPAFRALERRQAAEPKVRQMELFANLIRLPEVRVILLMSVGVFFFNHALNSWLPEILRSGGMDATSAGFWAAMPTAVGIAAALLIPRLATPGYRHSILAALFASAAVATLLLHSGSGPLLALGLVCQGIARGAITSIIMLCLLEARNVSSRFAGSAGGLFFTVGEMGGVLGSVTLGAMYDATGGFAAGLFTLTIICLAQLLLLQRLRRAGA
ncbi:MAG: CynX/NimT family MFS transporter [Burkholderiales bacterium]